MEITINRYPVMAAWCYCVARRALGWNDDEAKSMAITRANLGAAAKAGHLQHGSVQKEPLSVGQDVKSGETQTVFVDQVPFAGMAPYVGLTEDGQHRGVMHSAGVAHVIEPAEYDKRVIQKFGEHYPLVEAALMRLAESIPPARLNSEAYAIYCKFRPDTMRGQKGAFDLQRVEQLIQEQAGPDMAG
jgi:hypothetical protein